MYKTELTKAEISVATYFKEYNNKEHFLEFCKACKGYGKTWACPPFEPDITEDLNKYTTAQIFGLKIVINDEVRQNCTNKDDATKLIYEILDSVRGEFDDEMLKKEQQTPNSRLFFAGSCRRCKKGKCTRPKGLPCVKPEQMRPSLESVGFDLGKTSTDLLNIELKWCKDALVPEYLTLIYGLFI